jgi:N-acetylated-alpha-linked acidic dipeptidase
MFNFRPDYFEKKHLKLNSLFLLSFSKGLPIQDASTFIKETPSTQHINDYIKTYASTHRLPGTEQDQLLAEWTLSQFQQLGLPDSHMETFYPTLNQPSYQQVSIVQPQSTRVVLEHSYHTEAQSSTSSPPPFHGKCLLLYTRR